MVGDKQSTYEHYLPRVVEFKDKLPPWAWISSRDSYVEVDPDRAYPLFMELLGWTIEDLTWQRVEALTSIIREAIREITGTPLFLRIPKSKSGDPRIYDARRYPRSLEAIDWRSLYVMVKRAAKA